MADRYGDDDRYRGARGEDWRERDERWRGGTSDRERGFTDRASDEVRSWFGDEDAERRRERDRLRDRGEWRGAYDRPPSRERGYGAPPGREWRDTERERQRDQSYGGPARFNSQRDFGRTDRYANADEGMEYGARGSSRDWRGYPGGGGYGDAYEIDRGRHSVRGTSGYEAGGSFESGPYYGRGPRGYQRSDDRIREEVCERLARDGRIDASDIDIGVENGEVTLDGSVDNRDTKRLAEDIVENVFGVRDVRNQLKVHRPDMSPVGTSGRIGTVMKGMTGTEDPVTKSEK